MVPVTLARAGDDYVIARSLDPQLAPGDVIIRVAALVAHNATLAQMLVALSGKPADIKILTIRRASAERTLRVAVQHII